MPTYVCSKNVNQQGLYIVHDLACNFLPTLENRVNAKSHDSYQGALDFLEGVNEGRGLHFSVCEHCCPTRPMVTSI